MCLQTHWLERCLPAFIISLVNNCFFFLVLDTEGTTLRGHIKEKLAFH